MRTLNLLSLLSLLSLFSLLLIGCSSKHNISVEPIDYSTIYKNANDNSLVLPDNRNTNHYKILLYGNSHVVGLSKRLTVIFNLAQPEKKVIVKTAPRSMYLNERLKHRGSLVTLKSNSWSHVIFQAQKYSQSGLIDYPIDAAQAWIKRAKEIGSTAILFPEHPQRKNLLEGQRIHALHQRIANNENACIAPVGLIWDKVISQKPKLVLHRRDGNHASNIGKFLTTLVFYQVISGEPANLIPFIDDVGISEETQYFLKQVTSEFLDANPACEF